MPIIPLPEEHEAPTELREESKELHYCINCVDFRSQLRGTFAYDISKHQRGLGHWATSPVFDSVEGFYAWAKANGWAYHKLSSMFVLSKTFE